MENPDKYHKHIRCSLTNETPFAGPDAAFSAFLQAKASHMTPPFSLTEAFIFRLHNPRPSEPFRLYQA